METKIRKFPLKSYSRHKKTLSSPFAMFRMEQVFYPRDDIPELLWLESLSHYYGESMGHRIFNEFADSIDNFYNPTSTNFFDGTISSFTVLDTKTRKAFMRDHPNLIRKAILVPFENIISLYPKIPMRWLLKDKRTMRTQKEKALKELCSSLIRLLPAKDDYAGNVRAMPLNRLFKWGTVHISSSMKETIEAIEQYPKGDRYRLQSFARTIYNLSKSKYSKNTNWASYFWNYNYKLDRNCNG